jgi:hypothetical protein
MSEALYVTPAQVLAAKLALELNKEAGEPPDEALEAIANARVVAPQQSGPDHGTSADEEALATLQRIEHQLQHLNPEASTQERSQPSTQLPWDPTEDDLPPWVQLEPMRQFEWTEGDIEEDSTVGWRADEPQIGERGGTPEEQKQTEEILAEYEQQQRERRLQEQRDRDIEGSDRDADGPGSGGFRR